MTSTSSMKLEAGINPPGLRPEYQTYRSPYGPQYTIARNYHGWDYRRLIRWGTGAGMFAGVAGIGLLYFASDVPRVRIDIMQKVPIIGEYFVKETAPEDDPF